MTAHFEALKEQHAKLLLLVDDLLSLTKDNGAYKLNKIRISLAKLFGQAGLHFDFEREALETTITDEAGEQIKAVVAGIFDEVGELAEKVENFKAKWRSVNSIASNSDDFLNQTEEIVSDIKSRIEQEDACAYSLLSGESPATPKDGIESDDGSESKEAKPAGSDEGTDSQQDVAQATATQQPKILTVDDSAVIRKIIKKDLKEAGYENVIEAKNGVDAYGKMAGVDLVLLDWNMPVMNGFDFLKKIRSVSTYSSIPVIMITTDSAKTDVIAALTAGANDYIIKPFRVEILLEKINHILKI